MTRNTQRTSLCVLILLTLCAAAQAPSHQPAFPSVDPVLHGNARWSAVSNTASSITGDLATSPGVLRFANRTIPLNLAHALIGRQLTDAAALFPATTSPSTVAAIYHVDIPASLPLKNRNTICGKQAATWLVLVNTDADLAMAVFSGVSEPTLSSSAANNSTDLCGTFLYTAAAMR